MKAALDTAYANYKSYALRYDLDTHTFACTYAGRGTIVEDAGITGVFLRGKKVFGLGDYGRSHFRWWEEMDSAHLSIFYEDGPAEQPSLSLNFCLDLQGIRLKMDCRGDLDFHFDGRLRWGANMEQDTFAVCLDRAGQDLRSALGPACSTIDNALFDRKTDALLEFFGGPAVRLHYAWPEHAYRFAIQTEGNDYVRGFALRVRTQVYERKFGIHYQPINKQSTFSTPPAGWMTWYAVQFDAGEDTVLANAAWQADKLRDFGATALWVDWEWFHGNSSGIGDPDTDSFHPDPRRYPRGLKHVADEIKKLGLVPALWVGFTNDPTENEAIRANPDMLLVNKPSWCGQYFLDPSHPDYLRQYLPAAFGQLRQWGFKALKWDCLPITLQYLDRYHDNMAQPELTSEEALRGAFQAAREIVGPDCYMLSCSGHTSRDITLGADIFDAARIGGDIFQWDEYISQCIARVMKFYAFHNVMFYNDPDNVVLRPKFNTFDQAVSRLSFIALLGLPITLGDPLPELPADRVELLRRGLPPIDAHPMDIRATAHDYKVVKLNLAIATPFENWNVVDILNLTTEVADVQLALQADLHLPAESYLVYDFWADSFLGQYTTQVPLQLRPYASRVLAVRPVLGRPQILSTSRHLTQGAVDILDLNWDEDSGTLNAVSQVVKGDPYTVTLYVPDSWRPFPEGNRSSVACLQQAAGQVWRFTLQPDQTGDLAWSVAFQPKKQQEIIQTA